VQETEEQIAGEAQVEPGPGAAEGSSSASALLVLAAHELLYRLGRPNLLREACRDQDGDVLADALSIIEYSAVKLPFASIRELLKHPHPRVRAEVARRLQTYEGERTFDLLLPLLRDPEESVRETLIELLSDEEDPRLPDEIVAAFQRSHGDSASYVAMALARTWRSSRPPCPCCPVCRSSMPAC
jgi:hypothetical protein